MLNMSGHSVTYRGPHRDDELGDVDHATVAMVCVGQDMGDLALLAFDHSGTVVYRAPEIESVVLANYEAAGRTVNAAFKREQDALAADPS